MHGGGADPLASVELLELSARALRDGGETPLGEDRVAHLEAAAEGTERDLLDQQLALIEKLKPMLTRFQELPKGPELDAELVVFEELTDSYHEIAHELVGALQRRAEMKLDALVTRSTLLGLLAAGISGFLIWRTVRSMSNAFTEVRRATQRLAEGDLTHHLTEQSTDTIGRIALDLEEAMRSIRVSLGRDRVHWGELAAQREADGIVQAAMIDQAPGGIVRADPEGGVEFANAAALRMLHKARLIPTSSIPEGTQLQTCLLYTSPSPRD